MNQYLHNKVILDIFLVFDDNKWPTIFMNNHNFNKYRFLLTLTIRNNDYYIHINYFLN